MTAEPGAPITSPPEAPGPVPAPGAPKRRHRLRTTLIVLASVLGLLLVVAGVGAAVLYSKFKQISIISVPGADAPADNAPVNILLLGSDTRQGKGNTAYGRDAGRGGQRSDTTIVLHISADRTRALAVSIPRDLWVEQPPCATSETGYYAKFNNAFDAGGAACTRDLVEKISGVHINHVVVVDFNGFKEMIDAMGGVEVCLNNPIHDPDSQLDLPAGTTLVSGERALAFVRARKTVGDGSDIGRIKRQQAFLSAAIRKVTDPGFLLNPARVYELLDTATKALTVSQGLDGVIPMKDLVDSVRGIKPGDVTFVTLPFTYRSDMANVDPDVTADQPIWNAIINDTSWPPPVTVAADGHKLQVAPKDIWVDVVNRSGGRASDSEVEHQLKAAGFNVNSISKVAGSRATSVRYGPGLSDSARTVAYATSSTATEDPTLSAVMLVVGPDWQGVRSDMVIAKPKSQDNATASPTKADKILCAN